MKYTIRDGVERPFSARVNNGYKFLLPLLVILAGVLFFMLGPDRSPNKAKPLTLGIYTVKTPDQNGGNSSNNKSSDSNGPGGSVASGTLAISSQPSLSPASSISLGSSSTSSTIAPAVSPVVTGGMGGGGGDATPPTPSPTTISCVNQLTQTATVCFFPYQACTAPLAGLTGVKAIDGTCIVLN